MPSRNLGGRRVAGLPGPRGSEGDGGVNGLPEEKAVFFSTTGKVSA
jgi:hypothetical protein